MRLLLKGQDMSDKFRWRHCILPAQGERVLPAPRIPCMFISQWGFPEHLKVAALHAAFCSWQDRFLFITTQFCRGLGKLHLLPYYDLVDMTLLQAVP